MNLLLPPELEQKLLRLAGESGRAPDEVAVDLLATSLDHDIWFRQEVEKGLASARAGRLIDHEVIARRFSRTSGD